MLESFPCILPNVTFGDRVTLPVWLDKRAVPRSTQGHGHVMTKAELEWRNCRQPVGASRS